VENGGRQQRAASSLEKLRRDFARAVDHADDADAIGAWKVKDEIFANREPSHSRQQPIHAATDVRRTSEELKDLIESFREAVSGFEAMTGDMSPDFEQVEIRVARLDDARHAQRG